MNEEAKKARNKYIREYRRKNPERVKKWNDDYWERRAQRESGENDGSRVQESPRSEQVDLVGDQKITGAL